MTVYDEYETKYLNETNLISIIDKPEFFYKFIDIIKPISYEFKPPIKKKINWPQCVEYIDEPKFNLSIIKFPRVLIKEKWDLSDNNFNCLIDIFLKDEKIATIKVENTFEKRKTVVLKLKGEWVYRKFFVPSFVLKDIINEIKLIISKII